MDSTAILGFSKVMANAIIALGISAGFLNLATARNPAGKNDFIYVYKISVAITALLIAGYLLFILPALCPDFFCDICAYFIKYVKTAVIIAFALLFYIYKDCNFEDFSAINNNCG